MTWFSASAVPGSAIAVLVTVIVLMVDKYQHSSAEGMDMYVWYCKPYKHLLLHTAALHAAALAPSLSATAVWYTLTWTGSARALKEDKQSTVGWDGRCEGPVFSVCQHKQQDMEPSPETSHDAHVSAATGQAAAVFQEDRQKVGRDAVP